MKTIFKYPVSVADSFTVSMHRGATFLALQTQHAAPQMWWQVDTSEPAESRSFHVLGTGQPFPDEDEYMLIHLGTWQEAGGALVWHLFEAVSYLLFEGREEQR